MSNRHHGYVNGSHQVPGRRRVWSVRVKDPASCYNGRKLVVASVHDELELARGLNVHFAVGTVDDQFSKKVPRAVDVCLEDADGRKSK